MTLHHFPFMTFVFLMITNGFSYSLSFLCGQRILINTYFPSILTQIDSPHKPVFAVFQFFSGIWGKTVHTVSLEEKALWLFRVPDHMPSPPAVEVISSTEEHSTQHLKGPKITLEMRKQNSIREAGIYLRSW